MPKDRPPEAPQRRLPSLLSTHLKRLLVVVVGLAAFMVVNTLYLLFDRLANGAGWTVFTGGSDTLPVLFQSMILTHTGVGLLLAVITVAFVVVHLPKVWVRRHRTSIVSGLTLLGGGLILVVTGLFILTDAASQDNRWAWWTHVIAALLIPTGYAAHRLVSVARPDAAAFRRFGAVVAAGLVVLVAGHALSADIELTPEASVALEAGLPAAASGVDRDVSEAFAGPYVPPGAVPPGSRFFPSPATTSSGDLVPPALLIPERERLDAASIVAEAQETGFASETLIGAENCVRCHQDVTEQWAASAHRFSSFNNPFYEATVQSVREADATNDPWVKEHLTTYGLPADAVGPVKSQWCGACHDPALLFLGAMVGEIDRTQPEAQAGLTCLACHLMDGTPDPTGNANYNLYDLRPDPYVFASAREGSALAFLHDAALKAKPAVHKSLLLKPFFSEAEYCQSCHKVSLSDPINEYRWLRGQDEYDNWHDSGIALNASRTFYLPPDRRVCQDCHMPPEAALRGDLAADDGTVRSHRFLAANTALPFLRGDTATLRRTEEFLRAEKLTVDIFALRTSRTGTDLAGSAASVRPGERVRVDVVVRNRGVGHTFPGGTNDSNEGWLELTLLGADGEVLARSGAILEDGFLDPEAHVFKAVILDSRGEAIHDRNGARIHVTAAVNVIGPGSSDVAQYAFEVPEDLDGQSLTVRARLLWRKFDRAFTGFAFAENPEGFAQFAEVPDLPVTEIAADEVRIAVGASTPMSTDRDVTVEWERYNDYGIALLLQGNTREARDAFARVAEIDGGAFEGHLNLARTAFRDGNLDLAYEHLDQVENSRPGRARAAWVWANVLQEDGRYDDAVDAYRLVLDHFPSDRAAWRNLGRTLYLAGRYQEALGAFEEVLNIDPEDRVSHYHTMLSLRALGREGEAELAEAAYERFRVDEAAQAVTRQFREDNPGVNLMAQPIHTHELDVGGR
jgi:tetratricopeptide (TPR) repeat protein